MNLNTGARVEPTGRDPRRDGIRGVFIIGMHSSGTSAVTSALVGLGLHGATDMRAPDRNHPRGIFESTALTGLDDEILAHFGLSWDVGTPASGVLPHGWALEPCVMARRESANVLLRRVFHNEPWALKDPRLCLLLPFWRAVVDDQAAALLVIRHPVEVARSLMVRSGLSLTDALTMWDYHLRSAVRNLSGMAVMVTNYERAVAEPRLWCASASAWLNRIGIAAGRDRFDVATEQLDANLRRQAATIDDDKVMSRDQRVLYDSLLKAAARGTHDYWRATA